MTDPNEQLAELWELSDEGRAEWWPVQVDSIKYAEYKEIIGYNWWYADNLTSTDLPDQHALDLITASAERWLVGKGWHVSHTDTGRHYYISITGGRKGFESLTEALTHASNT